MKILSWGHPPSGARRPRLLLTAADDEALAGFLRAYKWAEGLPVVRFGARGAPILEDRSGGIWAVEGYAGPLEVSAVEDAPAQFLHVVQVARHIAEKSQGPVWEPCAGASLGFLAMGALLARRSPVAMEPSPPSIATMTMAELLGIDIEVERSPGLHLGAK